MKKHIALVLAVLFLLPCAALAGPGGFPWVKNETTGLYKLFDGGGIEVSTATVSTALNIPSSNASPATTAGQIRHDSTVTGIATGALAWWDGDEVRYLVDLDVLPSDDDYVVAYDATDDKFYMKADATSEAGSQLVDLVATSPLLVNGGAAVNDALPGPMPI